MTGRLAGKVALITGAAAGQGAAETQLFLDEGAQVVACDIQMAALDELAASLQRPDALLCLGLDVANEAGWESVVGLTRERFGRLDILVNNAGVLRYDGVEKTDRATWDQVISVNQTGTWLGMKHAIPLMRETGGGSIVNVSSIAGLVGGGGSTAYHASKGAVRLLTKTAAVEYAAEGIRINSIHPGLVETAMVSRWLHPEHPEILKTPMGRAGRPEEIARGVLFLAGDESSFMTGSELVVDGGYTAS